MGRVSQEEWDRRAAAVGIQWVSPVSSSATKTPARCLACGHEWSPHPGNIQQGHRCPVCAYATRRSADRVQPEEWDRRATAVGLVWMGEYVSAQSKRLARCTTCDHEFAPRPDSVRAGHGCPACGTRKGGLSIRVADNEWDRRANAAGLQWIAPHERADVPRRARCLACGYEYDAWPDHVRRGHGCRNCIVPVAEWDRRAAAVGIRWLEPHSGGNEHRSAECTTCGFRWSPPPRSVTDGSGCPSCATTGLDRALPTIVYLLTFDDPPLMKVGVANVGSRRLGDHRARQWEVVETWVLEDGHEAEWVERTVMSWWKECGAQRAQRKDVPGRDGYTESVWRGRVDIPDTLEFMQELIAPSMED